MVTPARQPWSALVVQLTEGADNLVHWLLDQGYEQVEQWVGPPALRSVGQGLLETAHLDLSQTSQAGTAFFAHAFTELQCPLVVVSELARHSTPAPADDSSAAKGERTGRSFLLKMKRLARESAEDAGPGQFADLDWHASQEQVPIPEGHNCGERNGFDSRLLQALRLQSSLSLTSGIAHDVNNYLTVVSTCAGLLKREPLSALANSCVHDIRQAGERAAGLLRQLAQLCRRQFDPPRVVDLNHLILDLRRLVVRLLGEEVDLILDLSRQPCPVNVDPRQMDQVLLNLAVNARDAMPRKGTFRIATTTFEVTAPKSDNRHTNPVASHSQPQESCDRRAARCEASPLPAWNRLPLILRPGKYVRLTVADTGCGMSDAVLARIFEPGFSTKAASQGSGIGLATVEHILNGFGGQIDVASTPDQGTTFTILLPEAGPSHIVNAS